MGSYLYIMKDKKPEYFDLNKGFFYLDGINEWDQPEKYKGSVNDLFLDLKEHINEYHFKYYTDAWLYKIAERLYKWIGDDIVYQSYDEGINYELEEYRKYEETGSRFDYLYDGDTYIDEDEESL